VPVGPGQHPAQRDAVALDQDRAFEALFAPVDRGGSGAFTPAGGFGDAAVDGDVLQEQSDDAVVGVAGDAGQRGEHAEGDPFVAAVPDRGRRAGGVGDALIRAAEPQDLQELVEHDPVGDPAAVTPPRMGRHERLSRRQQRGELVPQGVGKP
jgi:hypothetical protein